ncbi:sialic acid-binding Ig-like lectin 14 isoform 1-T1 [Dama dama]
MGPLLLLPLLWGGEWGRGGGKGHGWGRGHAWGGAGAAAEPLCPPGSLQEFPGFELRVQESVTVQACMDVCVACSFSYPVNWGYWSPVTSIYWFREGDKPYNDAVATNDRNKPVKPETRGRFRLVGDPRDKDCSLIIKEARLSDSGAYYLRVEKAPNEKYSYLDKKLNLQVTEKPNIQFLEPLESGRPTKLTCSLSLACDDRHPLLFSWVGDALDAMNLNTIHSPELTLTPRPQDHDSKLTCRVTLQGLQVTLERTVQLNVSSSPCLSAPDAPRNVRISLSFRNVTALKILQDTSSLLISESPAVQLLCVTDSNPPAQLSWFQGSPALEAAPISSTGVLEITQVGAGDEGEVTCQAQNPLGSQQVSFSLSVQKGPPSCSCETEEPQGSWPLVVTLIRGALMGAGFLLTYGLTWIYYTRCGGH